MKPKGSKCLWWTDPAPCGGRLQGPAYCTVLQLCIRSYLSQSWNWMAENLSNPYSKGLERERLAKTNFRDVRPLPSVVEGERARSPARGIKCWKPVLGPRPAELYSLLVLKIKTKKQKTTRRGLEDVSKLLWNNDIIGVDLTAELIHVMQCVQQRRRNYVRNQGPIVTAYLTRKPSKQSPPKTNQNRFSLWEWGESGKWRTLGSADSLTSESQSIANTERKSSEGCSLQAYWLYSCLST